MDVFRLDHTGSDPTYHPDIIIPNWDSCIWTERFNTPGEIELKSSDIRAIKRLLPRGSLVSLLDSDEVMMIETHTLGVNEMGVPDITLKGRSVTHFTEHRHVEGPYNKKRTMVKKYSPAEAAIVLLWNHLVNATGTDVTWADPYSQRVTDSIPNVRIAETVRAPLETDRRRWRLKQGQLYPQLRNILVRGDLGLRTIRPGRGGPAKKITRVDWVGAGKGNLISDGLVTNSPYLLFDVYDGKDRTHLNGVEPEVIFHYDSGDIDEPQYLWSIEKYKTAMEVMSSKGGSDVFRTNADSSLSGWDRRVASYDAGEPDEFKVKNEWTQQETETKRQQHIDEFLEDIADEAFRELKKARRTAVFSGSISPDSDYRYGPDYKLGDLVTFRGDYDMTETMIVSEYVRAADKEGEKSFPGLSRA